MEERVKEEEKNEKIIRDLLKLPANRRMEERVKEEEKNEKIIRDLLKLPANRRCINCNSLGPQYVCTSFWTFVCATCSGIHQEFTHRVKSVSMARFTSEEVVGLRGGGNARAKEVYFKQWDSERQFVSDNRNIEGLRKFIKHVYVDRRYTGEKSTVDGPSTPKMVEREDSFTCRSGLHGMPYLDIYERHCIERYESSERSDESDSGNNQKHGDRKSISAYFVAVNDRLRDHISETTESDSEAYWLPNRTSNLQRRSSNQYKALDSSSPQEVHSLRDILDRIPTLRPSEALDEDGVRSSDGSVHMQRTISTFETRHVDGNSMEPKRLNSMGFERKNLKSPADSQAQQLPKSMRQPILKPTCSPASNNSVSIDCCTCESQSKDATNTKVLDSLVHAAKPMGNLSMKLSTTILNMPRKPSSRGVSPASSLSNALTSVPTSNSHNAQAALGSAASPLTTGDGVSSSEANHGKEKQGAPQPWCFIFPDTASQSNSPVPSNIQNLQSSQIVSGHIPRGHGSGPAVISHSCLSEQKFSGRKEFLQHLFETTYPAPVRSPKWQTVEAHDMVNGLQDSSALSSTASWHGPQPNELEAISLLQSSSLGSASTQSMPAQTSPYGAVAVQYSSSTSGMALSSHMRQQVHTKPSAGYQGVEVMGNNQAVFNTLNTSQHPGGRLSTYLATQSSRSSIGRNPFA